MEHMLPRSARIVRRIRESRDIVTLILDLDGEHFHFEPGQFNMLCQPGVGEVAISISGDPSDHRHVVHTVRNVGAVTDSICSLKQGDWIGLRGPYGSTWPVEEAEGSDVLIIAGGLGLAPVRPIIYHLLNNRSRYGTVSVLYGTRTPDDIFYRRDLADWRASFDIDVPVTVDVADRSWHGRVGVVTKLLRVAHFDPDQAVAFVCGPEIMMRLTAEDLLHHGVEADDIHLSLERNMKCAIGLCGHCQLGNAFVCKDGPVLSLPRVRRRLRIKEL